MFVDFIDLFSIKPIKQLLSHLNILFYVAGFVHVSSSTCVRPFRVSGYWNLTECTSSKT